MESQHQGLIRDIRNGRFDPEGPRPFGAQIISNRSLDEVIMDFLAQEAAVARICLDIAPDPPFEEGSRATVRVRVRAESSDRPVEGAKVVIKMISTLDRPRELFTGTTDAEGLAETVLDIPVLGTGNAAILCQAEVGDSNAEAQHVVLKRGAPTGS
jgi:hypothetical protein